MCGVVGVISKNNTINYRQVTSVMLERIAHRGPDDFGILVENFNDYNIVLGHRRLAILDISSNGHQPMYFDNLSIVYNGEVYNFNEIKIELKNYGYNFVSNSDTEVILKAYHKWGNACFSMFNGMWVICIYDKQLNKMIVCRDRSGVKPLYWYRKGTTFLFASELRSLVEFPDFQKEMNKTSLAYYFQYGYIKEPHSIYNYTYKLEAGTILEVLVEDDLRVNKIIYWNVDDLYQKEKLKIEYNDAKVLLEEKMFKAFNYRMISDVPVGVFLSGGIDSSVVAAVLQKTSLTKIQTYTIGFNNPDYDEAPQAKNIAKYLGTDHHEFYFDDKKVYELLDILPEVLDEPFADSSILPTLLVSSFAKKDVSVTLSADGGDELFGGYPTFFNSLQLQNKFKAFPNCLKNALDLPIAFILNSKINSSSKLNKIHELLKNSSSSNIFEVYSKHIFDVELKNLFHLEHEKLITDNVGIHDDLNRMLSGTFKTFMNNDVLYKVDKASMYYSLESREPFLDFELLEFIIRLPNQYKVDQFGNRKIILKDILFKYVPEDYFNSKKMGFSIPPSQLINYVKSNFDFELLNKLIKNGLVDKSILEDTYINQWRIKWNLFIFLNWYKKWLD